jgi:hypothetical protein
MPTGLAAVAGPHAGVVCAPPSWFRAAEGVRSAWPDCGGPFGRPPRISGTAAQRAGQRYEKKALAFLERECAALPEHAGRLHAKQWFRFQSDRGPVRWCQPDAFWQSSDGLELIIVEIKTTFSSDAWWQIKRLYEPVLRLALKPRAIGTIVICKSFDPHAPFPAPITMMTGPIVESLVFPGRVGVLPWAP